MAKTTRKAPAKRAVKAPKAPEVTGGETEGMDEKPVYKTPAKAKADTSAVSDAFIKIENAFHNLEIGATELRAALMERKQSITRVNAMLGQLTVLKKKIMAYKGGF